MFYLNMIAKSSGYAEVAEASFFAEFGSNLLWTRGRVLEELNTEMGLVVGGVKVQSVADWDKAHAHLKRNTGSLSFGVVDMRDKARMTLLKAQIAWVMENQNWFSIIDGLDLVGVALGLHFDNDFIVNGEGGKWDSLNKSWAELPYTPKDMVCQLVMGFNAPQLWAAICQYRSRLDDFSWFMLKDQVLPWSGIKVEKALSKCREAFEAAGNPITGLPSRFEIERALRLGV